MHEESVLDEFVRQLSRADGPIALHWRSAAPWVGPRPEEEQPELPFSPSTREAPGPRAPPHGRPSAEVPRGTRPARAGEPTGSARASPGDPRSMGSTARERSHAATSASAAHGRMRQEETTGATYPRRGCEESPHGFGSRRASATSPARSAAACEAMSCSRVDAKIHRQASRRGPPRRPRESPQPVAIHPPHFRIPKRQRAQEDSNFRTPAS